MCKRKSQDHFFLKNYILQYIQEHFIDDLYNVKKWKVWEKSDTALQRVSTDSKLDNE